MTQQSNAAFKFLPICTSLICSIGQLGITSTILSFGPTHHPASHIRCYRESCNLLFAPGPSLQCQWLSYACIFPLSFMEGACCQPSSRAGFGSSLVVESAGWEHPAASSLGDCNTWPDVKCACTHLRRSVHVCAQVQPQSHYWTSYKFIKL